MKKTLLLILLLLNINPVFATKINGYAEKQGLTMKANKVVDSTNGMPVSAAKINIPSKNYTTTTKDDGSFHLQADINAPTIMSIEKEGYKPFSLTMDKYATSKPIIIGIEKSTPADIVIEQNLLHLGDNNFSETSANASDINVYAGGHITSAAIDLSFVENKKKSSKTSKKKSNGKSNTTKKTKTKKASSK